MGQRRATPSTTSPTAPATTCATRSTPRKLRTELGWLPRSPTSRPAWPPPSPGTATTRTWWRPHKDATEAGYAAQGPVTVAALTVESTADPRSGGRPAGRPRGHPRLVQGELAARRRWSPSGCPTSGRCRTTSRSTPPPARPGASTPSRGTSSSRWAPAGSSARGWTCAPVTAFGAVFTVEIDPESRCSSPAGSATPSRPSRTPPSTPTWSTTTGARRTTTTRSATWPTRPPRSPGRSRSREAELSEKDRHQHPRLAGVTPMAPRRTLVLGGQRPARPGPAGRPARTADVVDPRPSST